LYFLISVKTVLADFEAEAPTRRRVGYTGFGAWMDIDNSSDLDLVAVAAYLNTIFILTYIHVLLVLVVVFVIDAC